jgi:hypothetical protein
MPIISIFTKRAIFKARYDRCENCAIKVAMMLLLMPGVAIRGRAFDSRRDFFSLKNMYH